MHVKKRPKVVQIVVLNLLKNMEEKMTYKDINVTAVIKLLVQIEGLKNF
ncbi:hypothetical protein KX00_251 [Francisella sp. TX07-6608]|nr:hypothetical protein KX00_251 [Francisella sp. TX07-6608]